MQRRPPYPAKPRVFSVFNPAITEAPRGLCPRCTYVVALRVDAMHQCNASSPLLRRNMPQSAPGTTTHTHTHTHTLHLPGGGQLASAAQSWRRGAAR